MSTKTFSGWKTRFGERQATEVEKMKDMTNQINRLEPILARQAVELMAAKEIIKGKR